MEEESCFVLPNGGGDGVGNGSDGDGKVGLVLIDIIKGFCTVGAGNLVRKIRKFRTHFRFLQTILS